MTDVKTEKKPLAKGVKALLYLAAGVAVALPLAACQPEPAAPPAKPIEKPAEPATRTTVTEEGGVRTIIKEVIVEKPVYIERPATQPANAGMGEDDVLATYRIDNVDRKITFGQIKPILKDAYGLDVLRRYLQLDMVRHAAKQRGLTVSKEEVEKESDMWLAQMAPDAETNEYPRLLQSLLQRQRLSRAEYDITMETNALLRKIAQSLMANKPGEETLREAFNLMYGEKVQIKHIACNNISEWTEAKKLVDGGASFEDVARTKSRNQITGQLGGELPAFTQKATEVPESMREAAFALKTEGELSDPVLADGKYHLIKLVRRIPPKAVKFEDMKDGVEKELRKNAEDGTIKQYRESLGSQAILSMKVVDPELKKQWDGMLRQAEEQKKRDAAVAPGTAK